MPSPEGAPRGDEIPPAETTETPPEEVVEEAPVEEAEAVHDESETMGEAERKTYEGRGEKVLTAERRAELMRRREAIIERQKEIEKEIAMLLEAGATISDAERSKIEDSIAETAAEEADVDTTEEAEAPAGAAGAATEGTSAEGAHEEAPSHEAVEEAKGRAKKNRGFRRFAAAACAIIAALGIGFGIGSAGGNKKNNDPSGATGTDPAAIVTMAPGATEAGAPGAAAETHESERGIYDGYGEKGMYLSEHKTSSVAFANSTEVAEVCDFDEVEMIKYTAHNQVESFADYLANLPEELQPEEFRGLSILETEARLESLSDEDFEALEGQFGSIMDNAFTRRVTLNGTYDNAYMRVKNPGEAITHENMELVRCTTEEHNLEVTQFYWVDASGREIGHMTVKITPTTDEKGLDTFRGCEQVVTQGEGDIYEGMPEIPAPPETPPEHPAVRMQL